MGRLQCLASTTFVPQRQLDLCRVVSPIIVVVGGWDRSDRKTALRLLRIVEDVLRHPFTGIGKPEPLKRGLSGLWSRRLTQEHRVVYEVARPYHTVLTWG